MGESPDGRSKTRVGGFNVTSCYMGVRFMLHTSHLLRQLHDDYMLHNYVVLSTPVTFRAEE